MLRVHLPPEEGEGWKLGAGCEHSSCPFVVAAPVDSCCPGVKTSPGWEVLSDLTELGLAGTF